MTAYRANPNYPVGPEEGSWAWRAERLAEQIHKVPNVILCQSGTQALKILLRCCQIPSLLTTSALTFSATVSAMLAARHWPKFEDFPEDVPVDLFGAVRVKAKVAADSCQAVGIPPISDNGVWSFNGRKNVPAGEGGAIYTRDERVAEACRLMVNHGENFYNGDRFRNERRDICGENGHVNEQTACLIYHGLVAVVERNARRTSLAGILRSIIGDHPRVTFPDLDRHALYVYPLVLDRDHTGVARKLAERGVEVQTGYIQPTLDQYPAFQRYPKGDLTVTHAMSRERLLVFPQVTPTATESEMEELGTEIRRAL